MKIGEKLKTYVLVFAVVFVLLSATTVFAQVGVPNRFYGDVLLNEYPAIDGLVVTAEIDGIEVSRIDSSTGTYGYDTVFLVEDPDSNRAGDTILFYIEGILAGESVFMSGNSTELNLAATGSICGDDYCTGGESCSSCPGDCGECSTGGGGSPGGGGGGGGGGTICVSNWQCTEWSECSAGEQTRECTDTRCGRTTGSSKPDEIQDCAVDVVTPPVGTCVADSSICAGDSLFRCQSDKWVETDTCEHGCENTEPGKAQCLSQSGDNGDRGDDAGDNQGPPTGFFLLDPMNIVYGVIIVIVLVSIVGVWRMRRDKTDSKGTETIEKTETPSTENKDTGAGESKETESTEKKESQGGG
jgi:hypothetical protein